MTDINPAAKAAAVASDLRSLVTAGARHGGARALVALLLFLPAIAVNLFVIGGPGVSSIYYSFTNWNGISPPDFVGLANWKRALTDDVFWSVMMHNVIYLLVLMIVPTTVSLFGAFLLTRIRHGSTLFRIIYFIPFLLITVVTAQIWRNLLSPGTGIAKALDSIGIPWLNNVYFLGSKELALPTVIAVNTWTFIGFSIIFFFAAMNTVDPALLEAARLDGVSAWGEFRHVVLPTIRPMVMFAFGFAIIGGLLVYDLPRVLTGGGPAGSSEVAALLINRTAIIGREAGYSTTMALILTAISAGVIGVMTYLRRHDEEI